MAAPLAALGVLGRPSFDRPLWKRTARFALPAYGGSVMTYLNYRIDQFIIALPLPPDQLAFYVIAVDIAEKLWIIPGAVSTALLPHLTNSPKRDPALTAIIAPARHDLDRHGMPPGVRPGRGGGGVAVRVGVRRDCLAVALDPARDLHAHGRKGTGGGIACAREDPLHPLAIGTRRLSQCRGQLRAYPADGNRGSRPRLHPHVLPGLPGRGMVLRVEDWRTVERPRCRAGGTSWSTSCCGAASEGLPTSPPSPKGQPRKVLC